MTTTVTLSINTPPRSGQASARGFTRDEESLRDISRAFDEMLTAMPAKIGAGVIDRNAEPFSPDQMFEPRGQSRGGRRARRSSAAESKPEETRPVKEYEEAREFGSQRTVEHPGTRARGSNAPSLIDSSAVSSFGTQTTVVDAKGAGHRESVPFSLASRAAHSTSGKADKEQSAASMQHQALPMPHMSDSSAVLSAQRAMMGGGRPDSSSAQTSAEHVIKLLGVARAADTNAAKPSVVANQTEHATPPRPNRSLSTNDSGSVGSKSAPAHEPTNSASEPSPFDELVRSIRLSPGVRQSSARMHLEPPELGRVRVDVRILAGQAEIQVRTETAEAAHLVSGRADELKSALEHHGIAVERLEVTVGDTTAGSSMSPKDAAAQFWSHAWSDNALAHQYEPSGGRGGERSTESNGEMVVDERGADDSISGLGSGALGLPEPKWRSGSWGRLDIRI